MGTLELLYSNAEDTLSDNQLSMITSAEAAGKNLVDIINNIIDLAALDPEHVDSQGIQGKQGLLSKLYTQVAEIDIRELCEQVTGSIAKSWTDKNMMLVPSWTKPSLSLSSVSASTSVPSPISGVAGSIPIPAQSRTRTVLEESMSGNMSSAESQHAFPSATYPVEHKASLELLVGLDEPDKVSGEESHWNFKLHLPVMKRVLTQVQSGPNGSCYRSACFVYGEP